MAFLFSAALTISSSTRTSISFPLATKIHALKFLNKTTTLHPVSEATTASSRLPTTAASNFLQFPKATTATTSRPVTKLLTLSYSSCLISAPFSSDSSASTVELKKFHVCYPHINPFENDEGRGSPFVLVQKEDGLYARVDLPGATREGMRVWVENKRIHFEANERNFDEQFLKEEPRKFKGFIPFFPRFKYKVNDIKADLSNGVLRIALPTANDD